ncbi:MAG TPA: TonB family protein [Candidatus Polarisedimenticolia bacterium]|jgi:peptidyl-prolyl cis-trans isomerase B (cyclophilin B)|nr:TonB family protein [Candidatus Polarisedimenticolia bacterium]
MSRLPAASLLAAIVLLAPLSAAAGTEEVAVLHAPQGEIVWRFLPKEAPEHVAYVKSLIARGFYDGTTFHRVIPHFVIQGGDPNSKNEDRSDDGDGEADRRLKAEFSTRLHYRPGTIGMARDADPDSGSCQFFIALENLPRLDGKYTIFAEVVEGMEVARRIASVPRDLNDNPLDRVPITVRLEKRPVREGIASREEGVFPSGEVLTGPGKPRPWDPKNRLFPAPVLKTTGMKAEGDAAATRLDISVGEDGHVIDARLVDPATKDALRLQSMPGTWVFDPPTYDGKPQKIRFEIRADGTHPAAPTGGGAPLDLAEAMAVDGAGKDAAAATIAPPRPAVKVTLPAGARAPARPTRLRLTVAADGTVADAAIQESSGDANLDRASAEAARGLVFAPAMRRRPGRPEPEPQAVYLDVESRFIAP